MSSRLTRIDIDYQPPLLASPFFFVNIIREPLSSVSFFFVLLSVAVLSRNYPNTS